VFEPDAAVGIGIAALVGRAVVVLRDGIPRD
jgi:hypothetical protein